MLGVTVISGPQLLVTVAGQEGTTTSPTQLFTGPVLLLFMASLTLASCPAFVTHATFVTSLALILRPALSALSALAAHSVQFPLPVIFASGPQPTSSVVPTPI